MSVWRSTWATFAMTVWFAVALYLLFMFATGLLGHHIDWSFGGPVTA